jgi:hypothetical protein
VTLSCIVPNPFRPEGDEMTGKARRTRLLVVPILSTSFGAVSGVTVDAVLPMTAFGLVWGLAAAAIAPRIARRGTTTSAWPDTALFVAVALAFIVLGAALLGDLLATSPQAQLDLLQHGSFGSFFYAIHGPFEWMIMPALLMLNWHRPGRRWLIVAAAVAFYTGRVASALYFAPQALDWADNPAGADLDQVSLWMNLNWLRTAVQDTLTAILLLLAAALHGARRPPRRPALSW